MLPEFRMEVSSGRKYQKPPLLFPFSGLKIFFQKFLRSSLFQREDSFGAIRWKIQLFPPLAKGSGEKRNWGREKTLPLSGGEENSCRQNRRENHGLKALPSHPPVDAANPGGYL
jgi:hypothetical protein